MDRLQEPVYQPPKRMSDQQRQRLRATWFLTAGFNLALGGVWWLVFHTVPYGSLGVALVYFLLPFGVDLVRAIRLQRAKARFNTAMQTYGLQQAALQEERRATQQTIRERVFALTNSTLAASASGSVLQLEVRSFEQPLDPPVAVELPAANVRWLKTERDGDVIRFPMALIPDALPGVIDYGDQAIVMSEDNPHGLAAYEPEMQAEAAADPLAWLREYGV